MMRELLVLVLMAVALFLTLMPHSVHCNVIGRLGLRCAPHCVHLLTGIALFALAISVAQYDYLKSTMLNVKTVTEKFMNGGSINIQLPHLN
jgi:hypothetical protein